MSDEKKAKLPNCLRCDNFYVTWDPAFPRGCYVFGFKGMEMPSAEVFRATGCQCPAFNPRPPKPA
ncbi:MAG: hypothetical protein LBJ31_06315 [Treponema sp.]|nr:hypothetical protein [Treponema sp.]